MNAGDIAAAETALKQGHRLLQVTQKYGDKMPDRVVLADCCKRLRACLNRADIEGQHIILETQRLNRVVNRIRDVNDGSDLE